VKVLILVPCRNSQAATKRNGVTVEPVLATRMPKAVCT
jgi:hypothetical protein